MLKALIDSKKTIDSINKMQENGKFKKYISNIFFPYYKNFEEFSRIDFNFPLTVIDSRKEWKWKKFYTTCSLWVS